MATAKCSQCGSMAMKKEEIIAQGLLVRRRRLAVGSPRSHRLELVYCEQCGLVNATYYRGRVTEVG